MPGVRGSARSLFVAGCVIACVAAWSAPARAFCGFFVSGADAELTNDATFVALLRSGTRTVLSMQNNYRGPLADFAMVVPVPTVLREGDVRTLPPDVFRRLDTLSAPRLVEYWEQDPCPEEVEFVDDEYDNKEGGTGTRAKGEEGSMGNPSPPLVVVEAEFAVDEYEIVILSALDSGALDRWLRDNGYTIPPGADRVLEPYVVAGSKFFVAKVDPRKVPFVGGAATLSPLRFHYDSDTFALPVRLGLINSAGQQDLVVHILARGRYEVANYENVLAATNVELAPTMRNRFAEVYAAMFDRTLARNRGAIVTEYAWSATKCDPCPGNIQGVSPEDQVALGVDVVSEPPGMGWTLTRLHARYDKETLGEDLVFREAPPIEGGSESPSMGTLSGTPIDKINAFQVRYVVRHPWDGPVTCADPERGMWGAPPSGSGISTAKDVAHAERGKLELERALGSDVPALGLVALGGAAQPNRAGLGLGGGMFFGLLLGLAAVVRGRPGRRPEESRETNRPRSP